MDFPALYGHRGNSAEFPENTIPAFLGCVTSNAEGIETDLHLTRDNRIVLLHDDRLDRTTTGTGSVADCDYHGYIDGLRTLRSPHSKVPLFEDLIEFMQREECKHIKVCLDIKLTNDAYALFSNIDRQLRTFQAENGETAFLQLCDRIKLGIWHTAQLPPAIRHLPYLKRWLIAATPSIAHHFWENVDGFSVRYNALCVFPGGWLQRAARDKKQLVAWDVRTTEEMLRCRQWRLDAIITDFTANYNNLRSSNKFSKLISSISWNEWSQRVCAQSLTEILQRIKLWRLAGRL